MGAIVETRLTDAERRLGESGSGVLILNIHVDPSDPSAVNCDDVPRGVKRPPTFKSKKESRRWINREFPSDQALPEQGITRVIVDFGSKFPYESFNSAADRSEEH